VIVELKSVQNVAKEHEIQLGNYLNGLKIEIGLLANFGPSGVEVKRKYKSLVQETQIHLRRKADWLFCLSSGKAETKNLYPVKSSAKDSAANLTGAINPFHPVK